MGPRVQQLLTQGVASAREIHRLLQEENPDKQIGRGAVTRYVATVKDKARGDAFGLVRDHVARQVPEDLEALEEIEDQSLEWARQAGPDRVERMAKATFEIQGELSAWARWVEDALGKPDKLAAVAGRMIRRCLEIMAREDRLQKQRDDAMQTALKVIEMKLRHAGLLDPDEKSPILIMKHTEESIKQVRSGAKKAENVLAFPEGGGGHGG